MTSNRAKWVITLAVLCALPATWALAQDRAGVPPAEQAAIDRFCADQHPCVIINGAASTDPGAEPRLATPGGSLAQTGRPPSACPEAAAAYRRIGVNPDAFVGPCPENPPPSENPKRAARQARASIAAAAEARGDAR